MAEARVALQWAGEGLRFRGRNQTGVEVTLDGDGRAGTSPMQTLLLSFGACMAADVVDIMNKSRAPLTSLDVDVRGERAPEPPRRYTRITMRFEAGGVADADAPKLQRALDLSQQTYCSVLHTLRPDVELVFELERR